MGLDVSTRTSPTISWEIYEDNEGDEVIESEERSQSYESDEGDESQEGYEDEQGYEVKGLHISICFTKYNSQYNADVNVKSARCDFLLLVFPSVYFHPDSPLLIDV